MTPPDPPTQHRDFEADWRERFHEFAEERDDDAGIAGWTTTGLDARIRRFAGLWGGGHAGQRWLDAGCGAGTYTRLLAHSGVTVIGADYSLPAVAKARARDDDGAKFVVADVRRLPFGERTFDGVLCLGVTQALSASAPAINELASLVRPGGVLWVDALNRFCIVHMIGMLRRRLSGRPMHLRYDSPGAITNHLAKSGMHNVKLHWMPILPRRLQRWQPWVESTFARQVLRHVPLVGLLCCHAFLVHAERLDFES